MMIDQYRIWFYSGGKPYRDVSGGSFLSGVKTGCIILNIAFGSSPALCFGLTPSDYNAQNNFVHSIKTKNNKDE
jgi:hypothetical protein